MHERFISSLLFFGLHNKICHSKIKFSDFRGLLTKIVTCPFSTFGMRPSFDTSMACFTLPNQTYLPKKPKMSVANRKISEKMSIKAAD